MNKRGIALQFNWIFVLIAGALILAFFFSVAMKQSSYSEQRLSLSLSSDLETIFTSAIISEGTSQTLPIPPKGLSFSCSEGCDCSFTTGSASKSFRDLVIFAPSTLEGEVVVYSLGWSSPYRISNMLFVFPVYRRLIFITNKNDRLWRSIKEDLPPLIDYDVVQSVDEISDEGFDDVKLVFVNKDATVPKSLSKKAFSAVQIRDSAISFFIKHKRDRFWTPVRTVYSIFHFPAVFSDDPNSYVCGIRSLYTKAYYLSSIMKDRAELLDQKARSANMTCYYTSSIDLFDTQMVLAKSLSNTLSSKANDFAESSKMLDNANTQLVQRSCPELF